MNFQTLLQRFTQAVGAHDSAGLAALFTPDGCYDDYFFGRHEGRDAIAAMLERFHVGGRAFFWEFSDPVCADDLGYAGYCFSYLSREPESEGQLVVFDGIGRFRLRDGLIEHYGEVFDRGMAFSQLGYPAPRIAKLAARYAAGFRSSPAVARHLALRAERARPAAPPDVAASPAAAPHAAPGPLGKLDRPADRRP
jgi:hypothetical protein